MFALGSLTVVLAFAASSTALTTGHFARNGHHHALAARVASAGGQNVEPTVFIPLRRSTKQKRCRARSSGSSIKSTAPASTSLAAIVNPAAAPSDVLSVSLGLPASPHTSHAIATTAVHETTTPSPTHKTTSPTHTTSPTTSGNEPSYMVGPNVGDGTFYATGLGACGITNNDSQFIAAVSHLLFDTFPGYTGGNPNNNPVCGRKVKATYQGKSVEVTITDRCVGCDTTSLDFSPAAFDKLADESIGRLHGVTWNWV